MPGGKRRARRLRAIEMCKLHANNSASNIPTPVRLTDSYRPTQRNDEGQFFVDEGPGQDAHERTNPPKRGKAANGDYYRPSIHPTIRSVTSKGPEGSDPAFLPDLAAYKRRHSPSLVVPRASKLPAGERKQKRILRIQDHIKRTQKQLAGHWRREELRVETERLLAGCQADLKAWTDRESKNGPQRRYNTVRRDERKRAQKLLNKAKSDVASLQNSLRTVCSRLQDDLATVSDDEEEGGVLLTEASTCKIRDNNASEKHPSPQSTNASRRLRTNRQDPENPLGTTDVKLRRSKLQKALTEAQQKVQIAEVDANYCCFVPLDKPYICLFPTDEHGQILGGTKKAGKKTVRPDMDPEKELQKDTEAGILRTNLGSKPPLWIEIEEKMKAGSFQGLAHTLGLGVGELNLTEVGGKVDALGRSMVGSSLKRRHSWLGEDEIAPEDLDSESQNGSGSGSDSESRG